MNDFAATTYTTWHKKALAEDAEDANINGNDSNINPQTLLCYGRNMLKYKESRHDEYENVNFEGRGKGKESTLRLRYVAYHQDR